MRTALLLTGQIRFLENFFENQQYVKELNCDIFISTDQYLLHIDKIVSYNEINEYCINILGDSLKGLICDYIKPIEFYNNKHSKDNGLITFDERDKSSYFSGREAVFRLLYKATDMIKKYEDDNNFKYDFIIKSRSDLVLNKLNITDFLKKNNSLIEDLAVIERGRHFGIKICDNFIISSRKAFNIYSNAWFSIRTFRPPSPEKPGDKEIITKNIGCNFACMEKQLYRYLNSQSLKQITINDTTLLGKEPVYHLNRKNGYEEVY